MVEFNPPEPDDKNKKPVHPEIIGTSLTDPKSNNIFEQNQKTKISNTEQLPPVAIVDTKVNEKDLDVVQKNFNSKDIRIREKAFKSFKQMLENDPAKTIKYLLPTIIKNLGMQDGEISFMASDALSAAMRKAPVTTVKLLAGSFEKTPSDQLRNTISQVLNPFIPESSAESAMDRTPDVSDFNVSAKDIITMGQFKNITVKDIESRKELLNAWRTLMDSPLKPTVASNMANLDQQLQELDNVKLVQSKISQLFKQTYNGELHLGRNDKDIDAELNELTNTKAWPSGLKNLSLTDSEITNEGLKALSSLKQLEVLYLRFTKINDAGLAHLADMQSLSDLYAGGTNVTDAGLTDLAKLKNLKTLWLDFNENITDKGLERLSPLSHLANIDLASTKISDRGLKALEVFTELKELRLSNCPNITEEGIKRLKEKFPNLTVHR